MFLALDFSSTDWWPFPDIISTDLANFLADTAADDGAPHFVAPPVPANDNSAVYDGERPPGRWEPRFRTVD